MLKRSLVLAGASALASSVFGAPIAADIIAYRTEDGVFAYTDDRDKVPARYAERSGDGARLEAPRLSAPHDRGHDRGARGERAAREAPRLPAPGERGQRRRTRSGGKRPAQQSAVVSIPTAPGSASSPSIEVAANPADGPVVVEQIRTRDRARPPRVARRW